MGIEIVKRVSPDLLISNQEIRMAQNDTFHQLSAELTAEARKRYVALLSLLIDVAIQLSPESQKFGTAYFWDSRRT